MRLLRLLVIVVVDEWLLFAAAEEVAAVIECLLLSLDVGVLLGVLC